MKEQVENGSQDFVNVWTLSLDESDEPVHDDDDHDYVRINRDEPSIMS